LRSRTPKKWETCTAPVGREIPSLSANKQLNFKIELFLFVAKCHISSSVNFYYLWTLAIFTIVAGAIFHSNFGNQGQMIHFMKNLSMAGGLILVGIYEAGPMNMDNKKPRQEAGIPGGQDGVM